MATVGTLVVDIAANIASLRSGVEEAQDRLARLERTTVKTSQQMQASFESSIGGIKTAWLQLAGLGASVYKSWQFAELAGKNEQMRVSFANLAASYGANGEILLRELEEVVQGTVSAHELIHQSGVAMMLKIQPEALGRLLKIAKGTAKMTGQSVAEAFHDIALGIGRQSKMILDNLGIIVSIEQANRAYAVTLGKTAEQLTQSEQATAFLTAALQAGEEHLRRLGDQGLTTAEKMQQFKTMLEEVELWLGDKLVSAGLASLAVFQGLAVGVMQVGLGVKYYQLALSKISDWTGSTKGQAAFIRREMELLREERDELIRKSKENWELAFAPPESLAATSKFHKQTQDKVQSIKVIGDAAKEEAAEQQKIQDQLFKEAQEQANQLRRIKEISNRDAEWLAEEELRRAKDVAEAKLRLEQDLQNKILELARSVEEGKRSITGAEIGKITEGLPMASPLAELMSSIEGKDVYGEQLAVMQEYYDAQIALYSSFSEQYVMIGQDLYNRLDLLDSLHAQKQTAVDKLARQQRVAIVGNMFGVLAGIALSYYQLSNQQSRAALNAYKVFAIAETVISTAKAAMAAFAWGAKYGGPPLGAAMAAIAVAAGAAQIAKIASVSVSDQNITAGGGGVGGAGSASAPAQTGPTASGEGTALPSAEGRTVTVTINVYGNIYDQDKFSRELLPALRKAISDGA